MSKLSFFEMGIDLTQELAKLIQLSVSDEGSIGRSFLKEYSTAIINNDIKMVIALTQKLYYTDYYTDNSKSENVLSVFDDLNKKLSNIFCLDRLIHLMEIEKQYSGWGDVFATEFKKLKENGIDYINLYHTPFRYAYGDLGVPLLVHWRDQELEKNRCPFDEDSFYDYFFLKVSLLQKIIDIS